MSLFREPIDPGNLYVTKLPENTLLKNQYRVNYFKTGGMGVIYIATVDGKKYIIKEADATQPKLVISLNQEKSKLESLDHEGIVTMYDFFEEDGYYYLVLEYIEGNTLAELMPGSDIYLSEKIVIEWMVQICDTFEYLHSLTPPVIYRDLKPDNIILENKTNRIKLIDFGVARVFKKEKASDTYYFGSVPTASPEHYGAVQTDARSDIYTIGATMHYLLTNGQGISEPLVFRKLRSINKHVSSSLEQVINKAIELDPQNRHQTVKELKKELLSLQPRLRTKEIKTVFLEITDEVIQQLKDKLPVAKLKILELLKDKNFSKEELTAKLIKIKFGENELDLLMNLLLSNKNKEKKDITRNIKIEKKAEGIKHYLLILIPITLITGILIGLLFRQNSDDIITAIHSPTVTYTPEPIEISTVTPVATHISVIKTTATPVYPTTQAVYPTTQPVYPTTQAVYPTTQPVYPTQRPIYPTQRPIYPTQRPIYPTQRPIYPTQRPIYPTQRPIYPATQPAYPVQQSWITYNFDNTFQLTMSDEWKQIRPLPPPPPCNVDIFSKNGYTFRIFIHPPDKSGDLQINMMSLIDIMRNKANLQLIDGPSGDNNSGNFTMKDNATGIIIFNILCFNSMKTKIYVLSVASPYEDYNGKTELNNIIKTFKWIE